MPGGAEAVAGRLVANPTELLLRAPAPARVDDLRSQRLAAEAGVLVRFPTAEPVVDVQCAHVVADRAQGVPQARRVGAAGNEAGYGSAGRDEAMPANVLLDPRAKLGCVHAVIVAATIIAP